MPELFDKNHTKKDLLERTGDLAQVAGVRRYEMVDGREKGVAAADVFTGTGFRFTVLLDRGMDISGAEFCGKSLAWRSCTGDTSPYFFQPEGLEWLRGFFGGLLCTCGMTYAGAPCKDEGADLGLHGRVSNTPAEKVSVDCRWQGDEYVMTLRGTVAEVGVYRESLVLTRQITAKLGESRLWVHDVVENRSFSPSPHMFLYHINAGFPVVDDGAELIIPTLKVTPRDPVAEDGKEEFAQFHAPKKGYKEKVYYHELATDARGLTKVALVNPGVDGGFGLYIAFSRREFTELAEWKQLGQGIYTVGIEPANCRVEGRAKERARGTLQILQPGERREYHLELGVLAGPKAGAAFKADVRKLLHGRRHVFVKNT
jgi:hypothetical protein